MSNTDTILLNPEYQHPHHAVLVQDDADPAKITARRVKNLGWLLRNWQIVQGFVVADAPDHLKKSWECVLRANLPNNRYYATMFASKEVLEGWLRRPVFYGVKIDWFGQARVVKKKYLEVVS